MKHLPVPLKDLSRLTLACVMLTCATAQLTAAESIVWHAESQTIDVDIDNKPLSSVAADFQKATGRPIHVPAGVSKTVSLKFSGKPINEGVAKILDGLNYHAEGTGAEARIVVIDPSGTTTPAPGGGRSVAVSATPRVPVPTAPMNTVYKIPSKDTGKGSKGGPGGTSAGGGSTDRAVEFLMREAAGGSRDGGSRDGGSKRTSPSRPPR
jgi:hypothetical protein